MSIKTRLAVLEKAAGKKAISTFDPPPSRWSDYLLPNGHYDFDAFSAAADEWSMKVFGKPLSEVAEEIAQEEGF